MTNIAIDINNITVFFFDNSRHFNGRWLPVRKVLVLGRVLRMTGRPWISQPSQPVVGSKASVSTKRSRFTVRWASSATSNVSLPTKSPSSGAMRGWAVWGEIRYSGFQELGRDFWRWRWRIGMSVCIIYTYTYIHTHIYIHIYTYKLMRLYIYTSSYWMKLVHHVNIKLISWNEFVQTHIQDRAIYH